MKFGYAWTFGEAPAGETNPVITAPAGWPAEFELGRLTQTGLFPVLGGFRIRFGYLERLRVDPKRPSLPATKRQQTVTAWGLQPRNNPQAGKRGAVLDRHGQRGLATARCGRRNGQDF